MHSPANRGGLRFFLILVALLAAGSSTGSVLWGACLVVLGVAVQVWSKGHLRQDQEVTRGGPYRFVRHPFYGGCLLIDAGIAVMSGWWPLLIAFPFWWTAVYARTMRREEAFLLSRFGERYAAFRRTVPAFLPIRRPAPDDGSRFAWTCPNVVQTEIPRALRHLSYPLMFLLGNAFRAGGNAFLAGENNGNVLLLGLLVLMNGASWELARFGQGRALVPPWLSALWARVAVAGMFVLLAGVLTVAEMETHWALIASAIGLVVGIALYFRHNAQASLAGEALSVVAVLGLCEVPWLAVPAFLYYAALAPGVRLAAGASVPGTFSGEPRPAPSVPATCFLPLIVAGTCLAVVKEMLLG